MKKEAHHKKENEDPKDKQKMVTITEEEYRALKEKEKEVAEKMLRLQADIENTKKRLERDKAAFIKFSNEQIIRDLIPFVDDFERAFKSADTTEDFNVLHKGVEIILKHLIDLLKQKGVSEIEATGKPFDPAFHEAILQVDSSTYPENTVIEELEKGYLLNDKVLRTAKVKVTKTKEYSSTEEVNDGNDSNEQENETL